MTTTKDISDGIKSLWLSPVKADTAAISRLEKTIGSPIPEILDHLEDFNFIETCLPDDSKPRSIPDRPSKVGRLVASGLIGASAAGLAFLAANSPNVPTAISLGFVGGAAIAKNGESR